MKEILNLPVKELKAKCAEQTQLYYKRKKHNMMFCYELFRRFFEEGCEASLGAFYAVYKPQIRHWIKCHKYFPGIEAGMDETISDSLSHFVFALRRHSFGDFASIGALLAYWRICVHSVIMLQWRKIERRKALEQAVPLPRDENIPERDILKNTIWKRVCAVLSSEPDRLLARLVYIYGMKPRQIAAEYPGIWSESDAVRVAQQRIKRRLQKDKALNELLKEFVL